MNAIEQLLQYLLHLDTYLFLFVSHYGLWTYLVLFLIIFCETGLVITPFLPGDSLLFTAGSIAAHPLRPLSIQWLFLLLVFASLLGNKINYFIGRALGPRIFSGHAFINKKHLIDTQQFYAKHGGKTILFARFLPIIRTFAPFVAGIGSMPLARFTAYNLISAVLWIGSLLAAGYFFGRLPFIKNHFSLVLYGIIAITLLPPIITFALHKGQAASRQSCS